MNHKFGIKQSLSIITAIVISLIIGTNAMMANNIRDLQERRQSINNDLTEQRRILAEAQSERNYALAEIIQLDIDLTQVTGEYFLAQEDLEVTTALLHQTEADLAEAEIQREAQFEILRSRIRFMHENNSMTYIEMLFSSENIADFLSNIDHIGRIIEHDNSILSNLKEIEERITRNRDEIALQYAAVYQLTLDLEVARNDLEAALADRETRIAALVITEADVNALIASMEEDNRQVGIQIANLEAQAQAVRQQAARAQAASSNVTISGGVLLWPVDGPRGVNSPYGNRSHPITGRREMHTGVDLRAASGTPILAAEAGVVVESRYVRGWGNRVVISHGNGLSTMYAHNSRNIVTVGEEVQRGQVIARAGSTGISTGPHLHFEVWVNGQHVNPNTHLGIR